VACFDEGAGTWRRLPPLPRPRSSHDAVVVGETLYVAGGWQLRTGEGEPVWQTTLAMLDLEADRPVWRSVEQPFQRRALAVAAAGGKVFVLGGMSPQGTSSRVDIYDIATGAWSRGPDFPMVEGLKGFGASAYGVGDRVFASGFDGRLHALPAGVHQWQENMGKVDASRFFHRLLHQADRLLILGGAGSEGHLASVESLPVETLIAGAVPPERGSWPGFRGRGNGRASSPDLPLHWSDQDNIAWRAALPGYGQSAPVVRGGQVFVTSVEGLEKETLILSSHDLETGAVRWRRRFAASQEIENSTMVSRGAPTPTVDGRRVYALWESGDLVALTHEGETLWQRSLTEEYGPILGNHGLASSPVLTGDAVIVQVTHEGPSYFLALAKEDGRNLWKSDREGRVAWTTPTVLRQAGGTEIIASWAGRVEALDAVTGEQLWSFEGVEKNRVASAVVDDDLVVVASSDGGQNLALQRSKLLSPGGQEELWRGDGVASGFASPLVHEECVLFVNKGGTATCLDRTTGEERWKTRLGEATWASPIAAGKRVYFFGKGGATTVLRHSESGPEILAENTLPTDETVYGAAAVRGALLVRTGKELVRIGVDPPAPSSERVAER